MPSRRSYVVVLLLLGAAVAAGAECTAELDEARELIKTLRAKNEKLSKLYDQCAAAGATPAEPKPDDDAAGGEPVTTGAPAADGTSPGTDATEPKPDEAAEPAGATTTDMPTSDELKDKKAEVEAHLLELKAKCVRCKAAEDDLIDLLKRAVASHSQALKAEGDPGYEKLAAAAKALDKEIEKAKAQVAKVCPAMPDEGDKSE